MLGGYWPREMVSGLEAHTGKNNYGKFRFDAAHTSGAVFQDATTAASTRARSASSAEGIRPGAVQVLFAYIWAARLSQLKGVLPPDGND
jgi:hypothetical protein